MSTGKPSKPTDPKRNEQKQARRFLTVKFIAGDLGYCKKTVRRWIEAGLLPHHRIGRQFRVAEDDYRAFLALRRNG
jgi:excisionase family DNA binding protein